LSVSPLSTIRPSSITTVLSASIRITARSWDTARSIFCISPYPSYQVEHPGLHRKVESGRNLVEEEYRRIIGKRFEIWTRLLHPTGEVFWSLRHSGQRNFNCFQQVFGAPRHLPRVAAACRDDLLRDIRSGGVSILSPSTGFW
jgi:hypothetical protein